MRPGSLLRACGWRVGRSLVNAVGRLAITKEYDRVRLVGILAWFIEHYGDFLFLRVVQDHLHRNLVTGLRCRRNPPVYLASMFVLCSKVTVDEVPVVEDQAGARHTLSGTGLDITLDECSAILEVLAQVRERRATMKKLGLIRNGVERLPTTSLVLEGVYFHDPDFLPQLFEEMGNLRHVELQFNGTPRALRALSRHCGDLESVSFLEPRMEVSILEEDILSILFGIPPSSIAGFPTNLLGRFVEEEDFRVMFTPQFPNLKKLDIDELYFEEEKLHDIYALAMILQPRLMSFGKHTGLTTRILQKYRRLWSVLKYGMDCQLNLTRAKFVDSVSGAPVGAGEELSFLEGARPMFTSLRSVELQKMSWDEEEVARFCRVFCDRVDALSLSSLPAGQASCLANVTHLRLSYVEQHSFRQVHLILDGFPHLLTLSIHSVSRESSQAGPRPRPRLEEDIQALEDMLIGERVLDRPGLPLIVLGVGAEARSLPRERALKQRHKIHPKLTTLRIASLIQAAKEPSEAFLVSLLERLPNLRSLCLGMWLGSLSHRRQDLTCTGSALLSVLSERKAGRPLLPHLEQLCGLPYSTEQEMCLPLARLAECLPGLHTLVVPFLDSILLSPTLRFFRHSSVEIRHKCATDQVFVDWEPEH